MKITFFLRINHREGRRFFKEDTRGIRCELDNDCKFFRYYRNSYKELRLRND